MSKLLKKHVKKLFKNFSKSKKVQKPEPKKKSEPKLKSKSEPIVIRIADLVGDQNEKCVTCICFNCKYKNECKLESYLKKTNCSSWITYCGCKPNRRDVFEALEKYTQWSF